MDKSFPFPCGNNKSGDQRPLATKRRAEDDHPSQAKFPVRREKQTNIALKQLFSENDEKPCTSSSIIAGNKPDPSKQKPLINLKKQAAPLANHNANSEHEQQRHQEVELPLSWCSILSSDKPMPRLKPLVKMEILEAILANQSSNSSENSKLKDKQQRQEIAQRRELPLSSSPILTVNNKPVPLLKPLVRLEKLEALEALLANNSSISVVWKDSSKDSKLKDEQQRLQGVDQRRELPLSSSSRLFVDNKPVPLLKPLVRLEKLEALEALFANNSSISVVWKDSSKDSKLKDEQQRLQGVDQRRELPLSSSSRLFVDNKPVPLLKPLVRLEKLEVKQLRHQVVDQRRELPLSEAHEQHNRENLGPKKVKRSFKDKLLYYIHKIQNHQDRFFDLMDGPLDEVLMYRFGLKIHRRDLFTLNDKKWLNDVIINFYMNLIQERSEQHILELASVYTFSTFFMVRLLEHGHAGVKKWTKNVDIFAKDIILVPVNSGGVLWSVAIIDMRKKSVGFYTSQKHNHQKVLDALEVYLREESLDKRQQVLDTSVFWIGAPNVPQQDNKSDSGVFSCMFAEYITRDVPITFAQEHIEYYRKRMILEIADAKLWR